MGCANTCATAPHPSRQRPQVRAARRSQAPHRNRRIRTRQTGRGQVLPSLRLQLANLVAQSPPPFRLASLAPAPSLRVRAPGKARGSRLGRLRPRNQVLALGRSLPEHRLVRTRLISRSRIQVPSPRRHANRALLGSLIRVLTRIHSPQRSRAGQSRKISPALVLVPSLQASREGRAHLSNLAPDLSLRASIATEDKENRECTG